MDNLSEHKTSLQRIFYPVKQNRMLANWKNTMAIILKDFNGFYFDRIFLVSLVLTSIICWLMQSDTILNWDNSYALLATKRLIEGGTYGNGFFTPDPPLIFYLYKPVIWIEKYFSIHLMQAFTLYVIFLTQISLVICQYFINAILEKNQSSSANILIIAIAFALFILPYKDFGKREHLILIFTLPYLLAISYELMGYNLRLYQSLFIGLFAAIGFCIKPHFLIVPLLIEILIIIHKRNFFSWLRAMTLMMVVFVIGYSLFVFIYYPFFVAEVVPFFLRYYPITVKNPMRDIILHSYVLFSYLSMICGLLLFHKNPYKSLGLILILSIAGYFTVYIIGLKDARYHIIPAYSLACVLFALLFSVLIQDYKKNWLSVFFISVFMFLFPARELILEFYNNKVYKKEFYSFVNLLNNIVKDKSVYAISSVVEILPAANYSNFEYVSQFMDLSWFAGFEKEKYAKKQSNITTMINEGYFINKVTEELNTKKPAFVLINTLDNKDFFSFLPFDYLTTFLKNENFREAWKAYKYVTLLENYSSVLYSPKNWKLYLIDNFNEDTCRMNIPNEDVVVLTGKSNPRIAYYAINNKFLHSKFGIIKQHVFLAENELTYLTQKNGLLHLNTNNKTLIKSIISKSINTPNHRLAVYQRTKS